MASVSAYITFDGKAEEAFNFYKSVFGGEFIEIQRFSEIPGMDHLSDTEKQRIMHVSLPIGESVVMGSDTMNSKGHAPGNNFSLAIGPDSEAETERVFNALAEGGTITQPLEKAFWGAYFGMLEDKFGIKWMVNYQLS